LLQLRVNMATNPKIMSPLKLILLGGFELIDNQTQIRPLAKKVRGLLAYLVLTKPRRQTREKLAGLLWPDSSATQGRTSLRGALATLRQALGDDTRGLIISDNEFISLSYEKIVVDAWDLEALATEDSIEALSRGFDLYAGELLAAMRFDAFAFEQWLEAERAKFQTIAVNTGVRLLSLLHSKRHFDEAISVGNRLLILDSLREDVHRTLIRLHAEQGYPARAIKQYQLCRAILAEELGVAPELETEGVYQSLSPRRKPEISYIAKVPRSMSIQSSVTAADLPDAQPTPRLVAVLAIRFHTNHRGATLDSEGIHRLLTVCRTQLQTILDFNSGVEIAQDDECILVAFGLPIAHGNDAERAVRTALALQNSLPDEKICFAVATGWLLVSSNDECTSVTGSTCSIAKTLVEREISNGRILLCNETYNTLAQILDAEPHAQLGFSQAWVLKTLASAPVGQSPPFVGRREILRQLLSILGIAISSKAAHAVLVRGEAGIGKTRLAAKVAELAKKRRVDCYFVRILDFGGESNRNPLTQLALGLLDLAGYSTVDQRVDAAEHTIKLGLLKPEYRLFAYALLELPLPNSSKLALESLDLSARSLGKLTVLSTLIEHRCRHGAVMIVIEDIHWAARDGLNQMASLVVALQKLPLILLLTSRPENDPIDASWRRAIRGVHFSTIELPPLSTNEARQMAAHYGNKQSSFVEDRIKRAEGNPLFLDQLLRTENVAEVPNSVQSVVLAQIDLLPRALREGLQAASVIGQNFSLDLLESMLGKAQVSRDELHECALITSDGDELRFVHALVQEAVYASILRSRRIQLHERAARWFAERDIERQAEHLDAAGSNQAVSAYLAAADHFQDRGDPRTALRLVERAIQIGADDSKREDTVLLRAQLLLEVGDSESALQNFRSALSQISSEIGKRRALKGIAAALRILDRHREALTILDEAQARAEPADDAEAAEECLLRGNLHFPLGETPQCIAAHQQARALANKAKSPRLEVSALGCLSDAYYLGGQFLTAHANAEACVDLARQYGLKQVQAGNQAMLAVTHMFRLEFSLALDAVTEAIDIARQFNLTRDEALAHLTLADVRMAMGQYEPARQSAETGLELARRVGARRFESDGLHLLGLALHRLGATRRPKRLLEDALTITRAIGTAYNGAWTLGVYALVAQKQSTRRDYLKCGEALLNEPCVSHNHMYFFRYGIEAALEMGDWDIALRYAGALAQYTRPHPTPWSDFHINQGRILARLGMGDVDAQLSHQLKSISMQAEQLGIVAISKQSQSHGLGKRH
jgi:DNA-binding SARP family transcriptional activator/tetratricopeptide (TPR) repeat protein